jgi:hypothetical protein
MAALNIRANIARLALYCLVQLFQRPPPLFFFFHKKPS